MRRKSNQQHKYDRQCNSQLDSRNIQLQPSSSYIEQNSKNHKHKRSISNIEQEKEVLTGSCTTAEDQQTLQQKMRDQYKKSIQTHSSVRDTDAIQNLQISVLLTSNSDLNLRESQKSLQDIPKDKLIETPKNFEKLKDMFEVQDQMESKKYYMMSCIKPKNHFQNTLNSHSGKKKEGVSNLQKQIKYRDLNQSQQKQPFRSSNSSFQSKQSYMSYKSYTENDSHDSYYPSNIPEVGIRASPKKRRIDDIKYKDNQLRSMNDSQVYIKTDESQIYDKYEDVKMFDENNQNYMNNKENNNQIQYRNSNNQQNNKSDFNQMYNNFSNNQKQNKFNHPQNIENNFNPFNQEFFYKDSNQNQQYTQNCHNIYRQSNEQICSEEMRDSQIKLNDIVDEMRNQFEYENQLLNAHNSRRSATECSSIHEIWDDTPLHERGIDTENWVDLKNDELKKFTLFHLYKARYGQFNGEPISNDAVVDIMKRFVNSQRVQNVGNYPWYSFDDNLNYVDIKEDQEKNPLCKRFVDYSKEFSQKRRRGGVQNINQQQFNIQHENQIDTQQNLIKSDKANNKLQREQFQKDNLSQNKQLDQFDVNNDGFRRRQYFDNQILKETNGQVDLDNIDAFTQESDEYYDINGQTILKEKQSLSGNNSPEFAQNFNPNFTLGSKQKPKARQNVQDDNQQQDHSYRGMIYNNLVKCETIDPSFSDNNNQSYNNNLANQNNVYQKNINSYQSGNQYINNDRFNHNQQYNEQSPVRRHLQNTQTKQKQISQNSQSTPYKNQNQTTKSTEQNSSNIKTLKKYEVKFQNKRQDQETEKRANKIDQRQNNSLAQQKKQLNYNRNNSYNQESPILQKYRNLSPNYSPNKNTYLSSIKKQISLKQSKAISDSIKKSQAKNNQNSNYQENYYRYNNNINNQNIRTQNNNFQNYSNPKKSANQKSFSGKLNNTQNGSPFKQQQTTFQKQSQLQNNNFKNNKTPTKSQRNNSPSVTKRDFSQYFHKDYAKYYYNKRKYESNSCDKTLKMSTYESSNKKNYSIHLSPNRYSEKRQKKDNSLKSILKNSGINENERIRALSDYVSQNTLLNSSPDDYIQNIYRFPNNVKTSEFNVEQYLNTNFNPHNKSALNRNQEEILQQPTNNYSQASPNRKNNERVNNNIIKNNKLAKNNISNKSNQCHNYNTIINHSMINNYINQNNCNIDRMNNNNYLNRTTNYNNSNKNYTESSQDQVDINQENLINEDIKENNNINNNHQNSQSVCKQSNKKEQHPNQFSTKQQQQQLPQYDQESNYFSFCNNSNQNKEKGMNVNELQELNQFDIPSVNQNYKNLNGNYSNKLSMYKQSKQQIYKLNEYQQQSQYI